MAGSPESGVIPDRPSLIGAARAGSREALGLLLDGCRDYLLLVANEELESHLRAKAGPSDLVQETFLEAQRDFAGFRGATEAELLAWLRRILVNNLANLRRRYHAAQRQAAREVPEEALAGGAGEPSDGSTSPSDRAARREEVEALDQALARLPEHYREVVVLRHRERLSFEEIGRRMGRTPDAARMLWARAFERLADELAPPDE